MYESPVTALSRSHWGQRLSQSTIHAGWDFSPLQEISVHTYWQFSIMPPTDMILGRQTGRKQAKHMLKPGSTVQFSITQ